MLLEFPNPKDPQDAEVAKMMNEQPEAFALKAQEWAIKYAGAPPRQMDTSKYRKAEALQSRIVDIDRYVGSLGRVSVTQGWRSVVRLRGRLTVESALGTKDTTRI